MAENENEQLQAFASGPQSVWRTEETGQCNHHRDGGQFIGSNGFANSDQPLGIGGTIGEGNCQREQLEGETGSGKKLIDQLEEFFSGYLAYVESHEERLKARLNANHEQQKVMKDQFENLKQSLLQLVDTNSEQ
ncbi:MAG: hypothetical protein KA714_10665 [Limnoraphis sp. WC205]|jgi:hypothetical protein|nr:hypothetical protein [Limnoraphis sp. WC205]